MKQKDKSCFSCRSLYQLKGKLKMRTQIWIINFIILSLLATLVTLAQSLNIEYVQQFFKQRMFNYILDDMHNHLSTASIIMSASIDSVFKQTQIALLNLNQLRQFQIQQQIVINFPITFPCDTQVDQLKQRVACRVLLPEEYQNNQSDNIRQYEEHANFLNSLIFGLLGVDDTFVPNKVYYASSNTSFMYFYPYVPIPSSYDPKSRVWYVDHFKYLKNDPNNNTQLTEVYKYYQGGVYAITMTQSMLTKNNSIEGVVASDIVLETRFIESKNLDYMVTDAQGDLILTNYRNKNINSSVQLNRFDDTNITGFNSFDWECLFQYANHEQNSSICSLDGQKILRRFNSVYQQEVELSIQKIRSNVYLIVFYSINLETDVFQSLLNLSQQIVQNYCIKLMNFTLVGAFILLLLQAVVIQMMFNPIYSIIKSITNLVSCKQKKYFEYKFSKDVRQLISEIEQENQFKIQRKKQSSNSIGKENNMQQLQKTFTTLYNRILENETVINPQCQILQKFQYPKKCEIEIFRLSEIIHNTHILNNQTEKFQKHFDVKIISKMLS